MNRDVLAHEQAQSRILQGTLPGRPTLPREAARTVVFLASDEASYKAGYTAGSTRTIRRGHTVV